MQLRYSLTFKVIALVTLPLIFELACVYMLAKFANDAEKEAEQAEHYRLVSDEISAIVSTAFRVSHSTSDWRTTIDIGPNAVSNSSVSGMIKHVDKLVELTKDDQQFHGASLRLRDLFSRVQSSWNQACRALVAGNRDEYASLCRGLRSTKFEIYRLLSDELIDLGRQTASIRAEAHERVVLERQKLRQALFGMAAGNIVLFSVIAFVLTRRITVRLSLLANNAARIAQGQSLHAPDTGADEIGEVDTSFHIMANDLKKAEQARQDFIAMVTHDLRTPLTAMKNIGKMLQGGAAGELPDSAIAMLKKSDIASTRMINLINDFLNIEKIRHGQFALNPSLVLIEELFQLCEEITEPMADEKSVTLVWQNSECEIFVDAERIVQVLVNLVCNAIKFSKPGGEVHIGARACMVGAGEVEISVKDFGRGIPEEMLDKVFERYQQVEASDLLVKGGSGLGLSICKAIVELHGGQIWATSKPGEGTTIVFRLPLLKD